MSGYASAGGGGDGDREPMMTFKEFVSTNLSDDMDPQSAVQKYAKYKEEYVERHARQFFTKNKDTGCMMDTYHPECLAKRRAMRGEIVQKLAAAFYKSVADGVYHRVNLTAPAAVRGKAIPGPDDAETTVVPSEADYPNQDAPPYFAYDPNTHCLFLSKVPLELSQFDLLEAVNAATSGAVDVTMMPPTANNPTARDAFVRFVSPEKCLAASADLHRLKVKDSYLMLPEVEHPRRGFMKVTPAVMSRPDRIRRDIAKSAELINKLDAHWNVESVLSPGQRHPVLGATTSPHASEILAERLQLDLQILYLRRVYDCCYYGGKLFESDRALWNENGAAFVRRDVPTVYDLEGTEAADERAQLEEATGGDAAEQNNLWVKDLDAKLSALLEAPLTTAPNPITEEHPEVVKNWEMFCLKNTVKVDPERWRCSLCKKLFRGPEFVHKHLKNKHLSCLEKMIKELGDRIMEENYFADPNKAVVFTRDPRRAVGSLPARMHDDGKLTDYMPRRFGSGRNSMYSDMPESPTGMGRPHMRPARSYLDRDDPLVAGGPGITARGAIRSVIRYDDL